MVDIKQSSFHRFSYQLIIAQQAGKFNLKRVVFPGPTEKKTFDTSPLFFYNSWASKLDSRVGGAKGPSMRKVRAPQGKDNG